MYHASLPVWSSPVPSPVPNSLSSDSPLISPVLSGRLSATTLSSATCIMVAQERTCKMLFDRICYGSLDHYIMYHVLNITIYCSNRSELLPGTVGLFTIVRLPATIRLQLLTPNHEYGDLATISQNISSKITKKLELLNRHILPEGWNSIPSPHVTLHSMTYHYICVHARMDNYIQ